MADDAEDFEVTADSDIEIERSKKQYQREKVSKNKRLRRSNREVHAELKKDGKKRSQPPAASLCLEHVFGYRGYDCRDNIHFSNSGEVVYHVAAVGIVQHPKTGAQRFYIGHTDDILCLALHPDGSMAASGEVGKDPQIHIWNCNTMEKVATLKGHHSAGVCALAFSADGTRLASVGLDENHSIVVWDVKSRQPLAKTRGHKDKVFAVRFDPTNPEKLVICGLKHIKFLTQKDKGFSHSRGVFGNIGKPETMLCVEFGKNGGLCYSGSGNGQVYCWQETKLTKVINAHSGPCFALHKKPKGFITAGKDAKLIEWDEKFEKQTRVFEISKKTLYSGQNLVQNKPVIRSVAFESETGLIAAGTKSGELLLINTASNSATIINQGHCQGEVWGLAIHPSKLECATLSDDGFLRIWNLKNDHWKLANLIKMDKAGRSVAYSPDASLLAVGFTDGSFKFLRNGDRYSEIRALQDRKENISDLKFSPETGKYLAVASNENFVDIYGSKSGKKAGCCKGSSSYITHIDWSSKGDLLVTNSGAKEQLFHEMPTGHQKLIPTAEAENDVSWATWTGVLGECCKGTWPPSSDVTDINATCRHPGKAYLATGDDFGFVKLFKFPCSVRVINLKNV